MNVAPVNHTSFISYTEITPTVNLQTKKDVHTTILGGTGEQVISYYYDRFGRLDTSNKRIQMFDTRA